jgi:hypothetical protein
MCALLDTVRFGASGRVPATEAERPLSVQTGDLREDAGQWAKRADCGQWRDRDQGARFDPERPLSRHHRDGRVGRKAAIRTRFLHMLVAVPSYSYSDYIAVLGPF